MLVHSLNIYLSGTQVALKWKNITALEYPLIQIVKP
jgi:hypothetical protein